MSAYFVTSCGTGRGKTHLCELLISEWLFQGLTIEVLKPIISGFEKDSVSGSDAGRLLAATGRDVNSRNVDHVSPWRYAAPLSPDMAAAREGRSVPVDDVIAYCRRIINSSGADVVLIEGVGGTMVPIDGNRTIRDLIAALSVPTILVVGSYLGSLSHALTAYESLIQKGIEIDRIVVNEMADSNIPLSETRDALSRFVHNIPVVITPLSPSVQ
ncbi:MAG: dethiobiotin synthase [Pseudomonadota bacterium]|nr:dethiobiotin synthase [Pseudomonadota bacterium]